VKPVCVCCGQ